MDVIRELCKKYTDLTEEEIATIQGMSAVLQPLANLEDADIFIDCPSGDGDAIVVAEAKPSYVPSSYKKTVVGLLARKENEPAVARTFRLGVATKQMKAVTQENGRTIQSVEPIKNAAGDRVIGVLIREQRVDEQRQISERLHFSEQSYEQIANALSHMVGSNNWLTECIDEALIMVDRSGVVAFRNSLARDLYRQLGYIDDPLGQIYENVRLVDSVDDTDQSGYSVIEITVGRHSLSVKRIQLDSEDMAFAVVIQDNTWKKEQEKALILKSVAIKEMHHRVKNNLQLVVSLLNLQASSVYDVRDRALLLDSRNRIASMALVHEELYRSDDLSGVDFADYLPRLARKLQSAFVIDVELDLQLDVAPVMLPVDIAIPCGLILNELIANALKHAFAERGHGRLSVSLQCQGGRAVLAVADDGVGLPAPFEALGERTLGVQLVRSLVQQLGGELRQQPGPGAHIVISFPVGEV